MTSERVFRILWGPTLESSLDFTWPVVGSMPLHWRAPRAQSQLITNGTSSVAWITGRYYRLRVTAQYFAAQQNFGSTGLQAFLDWAADSNSFTLVPNIATPTITVPGCYLEGPFTSLNPVLEKDSTQTLDLTILHPTQDVGLAWRGLFFEYATGGSLSDPLAYTFSRASIAYEINNQGYLTQLASGVLADGHTPSPVGDGLQGTLVRSAITNDVTFPEALDNAAWDKTDNVTITANSTIYKAPDQASTADTVVETATVTVTHTVKSATWTIVSADVVTCLAFVKNLGRFRGVLAIGDTTRTNAVGVIYDLHAGTVASFTAGAGTLAASKIVPLANGWFLLWFRGQVNGGVTTAQLSLRLRDGSGNETYTGDAASGTFLWGASAVHGAANLLPGYAQASGVADLLYAPFTSTPTNLNNATIYVRALRPFWADAAGTFGVFPGLFAVGRGASGTDPSITIFGDSANRNLIGLIRTGSGDSQTVGQAIPAGVSFDAIVQVKNLLTGGQAALDVGAGLGAFATAAPAITAFGAASIRIGQYTAPWDGPVMTVKIAPGLVSLADMRAR